MLSNLYRSVAEAWAALRAPAASSDPPPREASLVAVVRPGRLGDLLLTDPLLAALEERFPGAAIELLVDAADAVPPWLEENPRLRVRRLEVRRGPDAWLRPGSPAFEAGMEALEGAWGPEGPGVVLFADPLAGPVRGHLAARISRAAPGAWRAGLVPGGSPRRFLHRSVEPPEGHEIVRLLALARAVGADGAFRLPRILLEGGDGGGGPGGPGGRPPVVVHPGASRPSKVWPPDRWRAVLGALSGERGLRVVVVGTEDEAELVDAMDLEWREGRLESLVGRTNLRELARVLAGARLFLGSDSFPFHLAVALELPALVLPGPGAGRYRAYPLEGVRDLGRAGAGRAEAVDEYMADAPASSLLAVGPDDVLRAVDRALAGRGAGSAGPEGGAGERERGPA